MRATLALNELRKDNSAYLLKHFKYSIHYQCYIKRSIIFLSKNRFYPQLSINNKFSEQIDGYTMGGCFSTTLSHIYI